MGLRESTVCGRTYVCNDGFGVAIACYFNFDEKFIVSWLRKGDVSVVDVGLAEFFEVETSHYFGNSFDIVGELIA